jgi:hypothetical protein
MPKKAKTKNPRHEVLVLDVVDVPSRVGWMHIREALTAYGTYLNHTIFHVKIDAFCNPVTTWRFTLGVSYGRTAEAQGTLLKLKTCTTD